MKKNKIYISICSRNYNSNLLNLLNCISQNNRKARRHAENILRSLTEMGLPPSRVAVSAKTAAQANTNEVHLYLR